MTKKRFWALVVLSVAGVGTFWHGWNLITGEIPVVRQIRMWNFPGQNPVPEAGIPEVGEFAIVLPIPVSRSWDVFFAPLFVLTIGLYWVSLGRRMTEDDLVLVCVVAAAGLVLGLVLVIVFGLIFALVLGLLFSLTWSLVVGVDEGFAFGLASGLGFGLGLGLIFSLPLGLAAFIVTTLPLWIILAARRITSRNKNKALVR